MERKFVCIHSSNLKTEEEVIQQKKLRYDTYDDVKIYEVIERKIVTEETLV